MKEKWATGGRLLLLFVGEEDGPSIGLVDAGQNSVLAILLLRV